MRETTATQLVDYFNEHVHYELQMLRYSRRGLESGTLPQMEWNAMFAAFNVSARNIYEFLKGERGNVSVTDYRDYCRTFKRDNIDAIKSTLDMLNAQCFHMGRKRTEAAGGKIRLDRIQKMAQWVESNMETLLQSFDRDFRDRLRIEPAEPQSLRLNLPGDATLSTSTASGTELQTDFSGNPVTGPGKGPAAL